VEGPGRAERSPGGVSDEVEERLPTSRALYQRQTGRRRRFGFALLLSPHAEGEISNSDDAIAAGLTAHSSNSGRIEGEVDSKSRKLQNNRRNRH
jgi:hypothetical protein